MTRKEIVMLRERLLTGSPPYRVDSMGNLLRSGGVAGIHEIRRMGSFDSMTSASATLLALETCLALCQHVLDQMPRGKDE